MDTSGSHPNLGQHSATDAGMTGYSAGLHDAHALTCRAPVDSQQTRCPQDSAADGGVAVGTDRCRARLAASSEHVHFHDLGRAMGWAGQLRYPCRAAVNNAGMAVRVPCGGAQRQGWGARSHEDWIT